MSRPLEPNLFSDHYRQNDVDISPIAFWSCTIGASILLAYLIRGLLSILDYPVLSISEILWNCFVWLMPSSLVLGLRPNISSPQNPDDPYRRISGSSEHAAKSDVLRSVFKLDGKIRPSKTYLDAPPGLGNWDNSCYQNSVLQALASVQCLTTFFDQLRQNIADLPDDTTINSLDNFIDSLNDVSNSGRHLWTPHKLKSMSSWQQQDAQEYFSKLVDAIEKDTVSGLKRKRDSEQADGLDSLVTAATATENDIKTQSKKPAISATGDSPTVPRGFEQLQNPLEGLLAQRVGCTRCGYCEGLSLIPFNCITLPLGRKWSYDIRECFEEYTNLESIEGVECAKCSLMQMKHELRRQTENFALLSDEEESQSSAEIEAYKARLDERLEAVSDALRDEDFSEATLSRKCQIPSSHRVASTKSKQVTIMKPPQCLVMHVNRSLFDEYSGAQLKNYADVQYQNIFDMSRWCMGNKVRIDLNNKLSTTEEWEMDPTRSMLSNDESFRAMLDCRYELRAVITHMGRHENGHYVCYRRFARTEHGSKELENEPSDSDLVENNDTWWRLSDENVSLVAEEEALSQGGAFMLFYERIDEAEFSQNLDDTLAAENFEAITPTAALSQAIPLDKEYSITSTAQAPDSNKVINPMPLAAPVSEAPRSVESDVTNQDSDALESTQDILDGTSPDEATELRNRALSPAMMRTAGIQRMTAQTNDPFKPMAMIATT